MRHYKFIEKHHPEADAPKFDVERLISIQATALREEYKTDCLNMKQLQQVLNVGESNVYAWVKECKAVRVIGRRKVVPVVLVARYLVTGEKI